MRFPSLDNEEPPFCYKNNILSIEQKDPIHMELNEDEDNADCKSFYNHPTLIYFNFFKWS